jgi:peptide methionine sulfoxide reductase MsrA
MGSSGDGNSGAGGTSRAHDIAKTPEMTRINETINPQASKKHRTITQIAELGLQFAEDYHQRYLEKRTSVRAAAPV